MKVKWFVASAALLLGSCNSANAQDSHILSPLGGSEDNRLLSQLQSRNPGSLCTLFLNDGKARLMSYGQQAEVDIDGVPTVLAYRPTSHGNEASFAGKGIRISGPLAREEVTEVGRGPTRDVSVEVVVGRRTEHLDGKWHCQAKLITVRLAH